MVAIVAATLLGVSSSAVAASGAVADLERAMACTRMVKPESVLLALQREGYIGTEPYFVIDGIPVYAVVKPLQLHGLTVRFVEGWDYQGNLFIRAPGTPPGVFVAVTVEGDEKTVEQRFLTNADGEPDALEADSQRADLRLNVDDEITAFNFAKKNGLLRVHCLFSL